MHVVNRIPPTCVSSVAVAAVLLLLSPAQAGAPAETVGALLMRVQEESAAPFVTYCATKVPDLKRSLQSEYKRFRKRFRKATEPLRDQIATHPELSRPATPQLVRQFDEMGAQSFAQAQKMDARTFCLGLRDNMSRATPESMQTNMKSALVQYAAAARQGT